MKTDKYIHRRQEKVHNNTLVKQKNKQANATSSQFSRLKEYSNWRQWWSRKDYQFGHWGQIGLECDQIDNKPTFERRRFWPSKLAKCSHRQPVTSKYSQAALEQLFQHKGTYKTTEYASHSRHGQHTPRSAQWQHVSSELDRRAALPTWSTYAAALTIERCWCSRRNGPILRRRRRVWWRAWLRTGSGWRGLWRLTKSWRPSSFTRRGGAHFVVLDRECEQKSRVPQSAQHFAEWSRAETANIWTWGSFEGPQGHDGTEGWANVEHFDGGRNWNVRKFKEEWGVTIVEPIQCLFSK